jgi:hypothetical protein
MVKHGSGRWLVIGVALAASAVSAVTLSYQLKVGDENKYQSSVTADGTLTIKSPLGDQAVPFSLTDEELRDLKVTDTAGAGWFWVESRVLKSKVSMKSDADAGTGGLMDIPPMNVRMKMDAQGDVSESEAIKDKDAKPAPMEMDFDQVLMISQMSGFPTGDVAVGATWQKDVPLKTKDGKTLHATVQSKLLSVSGDEATVESRYEAPIPPTEGTFKLSMDIPIKMEGTAKGTGTAVWSVGRGLELRSEGTAVIDLKLNFGGMDGDGHVTCTSKSALVP